MEGLLRCPRFEVVCLGSCPSIMVCGFISLRIIPLSFSCPGNTAHKISRHLCTKDRTHDLSVVLRLSAARLFIAVLSSSPVHILYDRILDLKVKFERRLANMTCSHGLIADLKASMTTFPFTLCMGSMTTDTARGCSCSKLCMQSQPQNDCDLDLFDQRA